MKPDLSLLTACLPSRSEHLEETAASVDGVREALASRKLSLEWVIALDGPGEAPSGLGDREVRLERHGGVASARNAALTLSTADYLMVLDADDVAEPEGVAKVLELLLGQPQLGWVAGNRTLMDGKPTRHWHGAASWGARFLAWDWTSPFPFHPTTVMLRRELAIEVGGWPALPAAEDVGFVLKVSELAPGRGVKDVLIRHGEGPGRLEVTQGYGQEKELAYAHLEEVINLARRRRLDPLVTRPQL